LRVKNASDLSRLEEKLRILYEYEKKYLDLLKEYNVDVEDIINSKEIRKKEHKLTISFLVSRLIFEKSENGEYKVGEGIKKLKQFIDDFIKECTNL
jgi:hypothetical protein